MAPPTAADAPGRSGIVARLRLRRSASDRPVFGVAAGVAARLGVPADMVRAAVVTLAVAGGVGVLAYGLAWLLSRPPAEEGDAVVETGARQRVGLALAFLGALLVLREVGLWFGDQVVWPVGFVAFGVAAMWSRRPGSRRDLLAQIGSGDPRPAAARLGVGVLLIIGGAALFLSSVDALAGLGQVVLATLIASVGLALVFGPWIWRLGNDLAEERRQRIRSEERADIAAHLHDSALQTLSLIQRSSDPREMVVLARAQERELRAWLFGTGPAGGGRLRAGLQAAAVRIEADHRVPVEVVATGDDPILDERLQALVQAAAEAITNAAKHSGAGAVSVYAEAAEGRVDVWVSDQGVGFNPAAVPADRRGIAESIQSRMRRAGGLAEIASEPGEGTEVHLSLRGGA
jgi:phage shock protein PspC (stress-responsive transcriptional regulator)